MIDNYREHQNDFSSAADRLYTIITILRAPGGCPWDRVQTNKTTTESLIDESYEYLDGVIKNDIASEREEIGDIMRHPGKIPFIRNEERIRDIKTNRVPDPRPDLVETRQILNN